MKEKEGVEMDKRQLLIEEYLDLANEIIHRNKPEMEKEFAGFTLNELEVIEHMSKEEFDTVFRFIGRYREFIRSSK